jgi:hypothetical protein
VRAQAGFFGYVILYALAGFGEGEAEPEIRIKFAEEATEIAHSIEGENHGKGHHFRHYLTRW